MADRPRAFGNMGHQHANFNIARLKSHGHKFEIVVNPDQAIAFRNGAAIDIKDILQAQKIFFDAQKGQIAGETELISVFETKDPVAVAEKIIKTGEIQLTTEYREKLREEKKKKIIYIIHRNAVDPKTGFPHPMQRIELALDEAKAHIDEFKSAEDQVKELVDKLRAILPLRFEIVTIETHLPSQYAASAYRILKAYGTVLKDNWQNDGSLLANVEMPAGMQQEYYDAINKATHGSAQAKVVSKR